MTRYIDAEKNDCREKPSSNGDRIRAMTDEELAVWIVHKTEGNGFDGYEEHVKAWLDWLKQGVEDAKIH